MEKNMPNDIDSYLSQGDGHAGEKESWKGLAQKFYSDMNYLVQKEGLLIRTEMSEKIGQVKAASVSLVSGGVVLFVGLLCVAATAIIALDLVMELWLASVVVTAIFLIAGGIMLGAAKKKLDANKLKPYRSIQAVEEFSHTLKEKVHEITKH
jgi:hypothetical protein